MGLSSITFEYEMVALSRRILSWFVAGCISMGVLLVDRPSLLFALPLGIPGSPRRVCCRARVRIQDPRAHNRCEVDDGVEVFSAFMSSPGSPSRPYRLLGEASSTPPRWSRRGSAACPTRWSLPPCPCGAEAHALGPPPHARVRSSPLLSSVVHPCPFRRHCPGVGSG